MSMRSEKSDDPRGPTPRSDGTLTPLAPPAPLGAAPPSYFQPVVRVGSTTVALPEGTRSHTPGGGPQPPAPVAAGCLSPSFLAPPSSNGNRTPDQLSVTEIPLMNQGGVPHLHAHQRVPSQATNSPMIHVGVGGSGGGPGSEDSYSTNGGGGGFVTSTSPYFPPHQSHSGLSVMQLERRVMELQLQLQHAKKTHKRSASQISTVSNSGPPPPQPIATPPPFGSHIVAPPPPTTAPPPAPLSDGSNRGSVRSALPHIRHGSYADGGSLGGSLVMMSPRLLHSTAIRDRDTRIAYLEKLLRQRDPSFREQGSSSQHQRESSSLEAASLSMVGDESVDPNDDDDEDNASDCPSFVEKMVAVEMATQTDDVVVMLPHQAAIAKRSVETQCEEWLAALPAKEALPTTLTPPTTTPPAMDSDSNGSSKTGLDEEQEDNEDASSSVPPLPRTALQPVEQMQQLFIQCGFLMTRPLNVTLTPQVTDPSSFLVAANLPPSVASVAVGGGAPYGSNSGSSAAPHAAGSKGGSSSAARHHHQHTMSGTSTSSTVVQTQPQQQGKQLSLQQQQHQRTASSGHSRSNNLSFQGGGSSSSTAAVPSNTTTPMMKTFAAATAGAPPSNQRTHSRNATNSNEVETATGSTATTTARVATAGAAPPGHQRQGSLASASDVASPRPSGSTTSFTHKPYAPSPTASNAFLSRGINSSTPTQQQSAAAAGRSPPPPPLTQQQTTTTPTTSLSQHHRRQSSVGFGGNSLTSQSSPLMLETLPSGSQWADDFDDDDGEPVVFGGGSAVKNPPLLFGGSRSTTETPKNVSTGNRSATL